MRFPGSRGERVATVAAIAVGTAASANTQLSPWASSQGPTSLVAIWRETRPSSLASHAVPSHRGSESPSFTTPSDTGPGCMRVCFLKFCFY